MSQYMPNTAISSAPVTNAIGSEDQPGMPDERSAKSFSRCTNWKRPLRWPLTMVNIAAVITRAPAVAAIVSPMAAPPAGAVLAIRVVNAQRVISLLSFVTENAEVLRGAQNQEPKT